MVREHFEIIHFVNMTPIVALCVFASVYLKVASAIKGYIPFDGPIKEIISSPQPHTYLSTDDLPQNFDWRNVNGTNYGSKVLTQQNPSVCGSCWAEAATGALSDRYAIATEGKLRINLAPQQLINFNQQYVACIQFCHLKLQILFV